MAASTGPRWSPLDLGYTAQLGAALCLLLEEALVVRLQAERLFCSGRLAQTVWLPTRRAPSAASIASREEQIAGLGVD